MWLVVGAIRRNGRLVQLPEILTNLATDVGWIPKEQVTWEKGKSLPWTKFGEFRDVTEQAILLAKSDHFTFDLSLLLSPDPTSSWWVRYPERYSPFGRRPYQSLAHSHPYSRIVEGWTRTPLPFPE